MKEEETEEAMNNIKTAALREVQNRRTNLKKLITEMREKQRRKEINLANRLQAVKYNMAQKMSVAYKKGNVAHCIKIKKGETKESRRLYCVANFPDNILNFQECNDTEDFCHFCCDNEFGDFNQSERKFCYKESCITENVNEQEMLMNSMIK